MFPLVLKIYFSFIQESADNSDPVLIAAQKLAGILRQKKAFTNTATFDLKCSVGVIPSESCNSSFYTDYPTGLWAGVGRGERCKSTRERNGTR